MVTLDVSTGKETLISFLRKGRALFEHGETLPLDLCTRVAAAWCSKLQRPPGAACGGISCFPRVLRSESGMRLTY